MELKRTINDFEEGWEIIQKGITKITDCFKEDKTVMFSPEEYMMLYSTVISLCNKRGMKFFKVLYDKYKETFEDYLISEVLPSLRENRGEIMIKELLKSWSNHKVMVKHVSNIFGGLNMIIRRRLLPSLTEVGISCFHQLVCQEFYGEVMDIVLSLIHKERDGQYIDRALVKESLLFLVEIDSNTRKNYYDDFEAFLLKATEKYYSNKASDWIRQDSIVAYTLKAEKCLNDEKERISHYLYSNTIEKLLQEVRNQLCSELLEEGHTSILSLLQNEKVDNLSRIFRLCSQSLTPCRLEEIFEQHITYEGMALVSQTIDAIRNRQADHEDFIRLQLQILFVRKLAELHDKCMKLVNISFENHPNFCLSMKYAFEKCCEKTVAGRTIAELLGTFCDYILEKGVGGNFSDETIEESLEKVVKLLRYVPDMDNFEKFYRQKLGQRLLFSKIVTYDHVRSMIAKLEHLRVGFSSDIKGMIKDIELARENFSSFEQYLCKNSDARPAIHFISTVLGAKFWPTYKSFNLNLPAEMIKCAKVFEEYFEIENKYKKLTWSDSLGTCVLSCSFESQIMEIILSPSQAAILLLFNSSEWLSYNDIMTQLNLDNEDVNILLYSLSCQKYKIINKEPDTSSILPTDLFAFNYKFTADKMERIEISRPPVEDEKNNRRMISANINQDRDVAIDAGLVQIIKEHRELNSQHLVIECIKRLQKFFEPDIERIKERIKSLVLRRYMERDINNPRMLKYLP